MTTGYILIVAILVLGGVIATIGDRIGTRVGKARLSLFNLRPRKTAVLVTILTGSVISASTLGILFAVSDQLRTGVFELRRIQNNLARAREELEQTRLLKNEIEIERDKAREEQRGAQRRLDATNQSLQAVIEKQNRTEAQLNNAQAQLSQAQENFEAAQAQLGETQAQLQQVAANFEAAQTQLRTVSQQAGSLRAEIEQLQGDRQELIRQRAQVQAQIDLRDQEIAERNRAIALRETRLKELETQQIFLAREVESLERNLQVLRQGLQALRQGNVALLRGQVLSAGVVRIVNPIAARQAVDRLLQEANRAATQATRPGAGNLDEQVIRITPAEVEQLIAQIDDGQDYVVRILSAGNYLLGERSVQVFADAAINQTVFQPGEVVAATAIDSSSNLTGEQIRQRIETLLAASQFRARRAGMLTDAIGLGDIQTLFRFVEQIRQYRQPVDVRAIAADTIYTAGPLKIELIAVQDGRIIFRTGSIGPENNDIPPF